MLQQIMLLICDQPQAQALCGQLPVIETRQAPCNNAPGHQAASPTTVSSTENTTAHNQAGRRW